MLWIAVNIIQFKFYVTNTRFFSAWLLIIITMMVSFIDTVNVQERSVITSIVWTVDDKLSKESNLNVWHPFKVSTVPYV